MLYLIGFMGVGKSTIGLQLAKQFNLQFIDTDKEIEKKTNKKILDIFKKNGENHFRNMESRFIRNIKEKSIIACGGGLPLSNNNMDYIKSKGTCIYLRASEKTLYNRLKGKINIRPLIYQKSDKDLRLFIKEKLTQREAVYKKADYIINTNIFTEKEILREINALPLSF